MRRAHAFPRRTALAVGVLLPIAETVRRWGDFGYAPRWLDDYFVGAFLLVAAWRSRRDAREGQRWLAAAWGCAVGVGFMSFFGNLQSLHVQDSKTVPHELVTAVVGAGWLLAIAALAASLRRIPADAS